MRVFLIDRLFDLIQMGRCIAFPVGLQYITLLWVDKFDMIR